MKKSDSLHVDTNLLKLKVYQKKYWDGRGHKLVCPLWLQKSKIGCISQKN